PSHVRQANRTMGRRVGRGWIDRMLSLVRAALLPAVHLLPTSGAHVRASTRGLSGPGLLSGRAGLSGSSHLPAQLLTMAAARSRVQRLLRVALKREGRVADGHGRFNDSGAKRKPI